MIYCKTCSEELFCEYFGDLANRNRYPTMEICDNCGWGLFNAEGTRYDSRVVHKLDMLNDNKEVVGVFSVLAKDYAEAIYIYDYIRHNLSCDLIKYYTENKCV